jgi:hypothetical protein
MCLAAVLLDTPLNPLGTQHPVPGNTIVVVQNLGSNTSLWDPVTAP